MAWYCLCWLFVCGCMCFVLKCYQAIAYRVLFGMHCLLRVCEPSSYQAGG